MRKTWIVLLACAATMLIVFAIVEALDVRLLQDPSPWLRTGGAAAAALGVGLLVVDAVLPIPSSLVMALLGAVFGPVVGTLLAATGSLLAFATGFAIGQGGRRMLHSSSQWAEPAPTRMMLERWGMVGIIVTRPLPIVAETAALAAGASGMPLWRAAGAALCGILPIAFVYAAVGSLASGPLTLALVFLGVVAMAGIAWLVSRRFMAR